jgi:hypothetical protein
MYLSSRLASSCSSHTCYWIGKNATEKRTALRVACEAMAAALKLREEFIVFGMRPDPKPEPIVWLANRQGAVVQAHTCRVNGTV